MFKDAYQKATQYTKPLVASMQYFDGTVDSSCSAFIVLNKEGWVLTTAHAAESLLVFEEHKKQMEGYQKEVAAIQAETNLNDKQKRKKMGKLSPKREWIVNHRLWWGSDDWKVEDIKFHTAADLAIGKITNFDPASVTEYPTFAGNDEATPGASVCKLGFPFHYVPSSFEDGKFKLQEGVLPIPYFPLEGIITRTINGALEADKPMFVETSTPSVRGQSGGPLLTTEGKVVGLQSMTQHFPLGFSPTVRGEVHHQFMNVGWAIHMEQIRAFLKENNIEV